MHSLARRAYIANDQLLRGRCLQLGDYVAFVGFAGWLITGVVFALSVHRLSGDAQLNLDRFREFAISHAICGLMAATVAFFLVTFVSTRGLYPVLLQTDTQDAAEAVPLAGLAARIPWYFGSAVISPLLAVIYLGTIESPLPGALPVVGVLGVATFFVPYRLARAIHADIATLATAVSPAPSNLAWESSSADSFWSSDR